ncbi:MAG: hypothetical protein EOM18_00920 [Clostridia bacterium]|nr:hypothetical protein [Clostridia bacterium]
MAENVEKMNNNKSIETYCKMNPNHLSEYQIEKIKKEYEQPRIRLISDELLDYKLWEKDFPSRQERFADFVLDTLHLPVNSHILEVGGGNGHVSYLLSRKGYHMTCMDPRLNLPAIWQEDICGLTEAFDYRTTNLDQYDYVIAQEPCEATEHIVRACAMHQIPYVMDLCGTAHRLISGEQMEDVFEWYEYLRNIDHKHTVIKKHESYPLAYSYYIQGMYCI